MRRHTTMLVSAVLALSTACAAVAAGVERVRLVGPRRAAVGVPWRATLDVRPAPRAAPRVTATDGTRTANVRVRRVAAGRYSLVAVFPTAGSWRVSARVGARRHALGSVAVSPAPIRLLSALGIARHSDGGLLIADGDARRIVRLDLATRRLTTFATAELNAPTDVDVARDGTVYVADRHAHAVFRVADGRVTRFAEFPDALSVAVDSQGTVFVTGRGHTVSRFDAAGAGGRYAGTGVEGSTGDGGPALAATLTAPHGIAVDPNDDVVVAEVTKVRRIDRATGVIRTIAGSGERALCGERGDPLRVCLTALRVAFEPGGALWVADPENRRLWRVAGGEARAHSVGFAPFDVVVESERTLLVADNMNRRVVRYDVATGAVTPLAG